MSRRAIEVMPANAVKMMQNAAVTIAPVSGSMPATSDSSRPPPRNW